MTIPGPGDESGEIDDDEDPGDPDDGDEPDDDPIEAAIDEPPARLEIPPAQTEPAPAPSRSEAAPKRKPGRPRGGRPAPVKNMQEYRAAQKSKEALYAWPEILKAIQDKGYSAEDVMIAVDCQGMGPLPTNRIPVGQIEASAVCGTEAVSAGDELVNFITHVYHMGRRGPARYNLKAYWKRGAQIIGWMECSLGDPTEIVEAQRRAENWQRQRGQARGSMGSGIDGAGYPRPAQGMGGLSSVASGAGFASSVSPVEQLREVANLYESIRQNMIASGMGSPPPIAAAPQAPASPPAPLPPRLTPEEQEMLEEAKFERRARALGYVPASSIAAHTPAPTAAQVTQAAADPVAGIKGLLKSFKEISNMRSELAEALGIEEPDDPPPAVTATIEEKVEPPFKLAMLPLVKAGKDKRPVYFPQDVEGGAVEWAKAFFSANPDTSTEIGLKFLSGVAKAVDQTSFGRILEKLAAQGGAAQVAAQEAQVKGVVGTGAPPAPAMNGVRSGPMA
jgi:hypothetical protein